MLIEPRLIKYSGATSTSKNFKGDCMLNKSARRIAEEATVVTEINNQLSVGILVNKYFYITTAQPILDLPGNETESRVTVNTHKGSSFNFKINPFLVEALSNVAVLAHDTQDFTDLDDFNESNGSYEEFYKKTEPLRIVPVDSGKKVRFPISIYVPEGEWVSGMAERFSDSRPFLTLRLEKPINKTLVGLPIINSQCELLGVTSNDFIDVTTGTESIGSGEILEEVLPPWILKCLKEDHNQYVQVLGTSNIFRPDRLQKVGVTWDGDLTTVLLHCNACEKVWAPEIKPNSNGNFYRGWWMCPNGCNRHYGNICRPRKGNKENPGRTTFKSADRHM